jgi:hypothetical protein
MRYLHDQHLPTMLQHACGVVTVNSTVGMQALFHGTPVITLGESVYQINGMVFEGALADFWRNPGQVDRPLFEQFRAHLIPSTQLNASFYARRPALEMLPVSRQMSKKNDAVMPGRPSTLATERSALFHAIESAARSSAQHREPEEHTVNDQAMA